MWPDTPLTTDKAVQNALEHKDICTDAAKKFKKKFDGLDVYFRAKKKKQICGPFLHKEKADHGSVCHVSAFCLQLHYKEAASF